MTNFWYVRKNSLHFQILHAHHPLQNNGKLNGRMLPQIEALSQLINIWSDSLENVIGENAQAITSMKEVINENTKQITSVKEAIKFMSAEVNHLKTRYGVMESALCKVEEICMEQDRRLLQLESYLRQWNLRLHGIR